MILIAPIFIEPLLNKYTRWPLAPCAGNPAHRHEQKIRPMSLCFDGRSIEAHSANVAGIGPTIRIALNAIY